MSQTLTRRSFIAGAAAASIGISAALASESLASEPASNAVAAMNPGTYSVTTTGCFAPYTIEVDVSEDSILDVRVIDTHESGDFGQLAQTTIANEVIENQSVNVDGFAGATITSASMKEAIREALTEAGATEEMFSADATSPAPVTSIVDITEFDPEVIVVGAGMAGLSAALTCADQGTKVLLLEQSGYFGGSLMYSGGNVAAAGGDTLSEFGYETEPEGFLNWMMASEDRGSFRPELGNIVAYNSGPALDLLTGNGADWMPGGTTGVNGDSYAVAWVQSTANRGRGIIVDTGPAIQSFIEQGLFAYQVNEKVTELIVENGAVVGVRSETGEEFRAPATILTCGGYAANEEINSKVFSRWTYSSSMHAIGNIFDVAAAAGAALHDMDYCDPSGGTLPVYEGNGLPVYREIARNTAGLVWLNTDGVRFWKEGSNEGAAYFGTDKNTVYCVANQSLLDSVDILYYGNYATYILDTNNEELNRMAEEGKVIFKGDTIEEAAEKAGLDPDTVAAELAKYNEYCRTGVDEDFGKSESALIALEDGPFYIFETIPNIKATSGGLVIDDGARVLNTDNDPIVGLYAAGETAGLCSTLPSTISFAGATLGRSAALGYTAALSAIADFA